MDISRFGTQLQSILHDNHISQIEYKYIQISQMSSEITMIYVFTARPANVVGIGLFCLDGLSKDLRFLWGSATQNRNVLLM